MKEGVFLFRFRLEIDVTRQEEPAAAKRFSKRGSLRRIGITLIRYEVTDPPLGGAGSQVSGYFKALEGFGIFSKTETDSDVSTVHVGGSDIRIDTELFDRVNIVSGEAHAERGDRH